MSVKWHIPTNLVGQERAFRVLHKETVANEQTGSYLLEGPTRVGKKTAALLIALELFEKCNKANTKTKLVQGLHPDLLAIEPAKNVISIEQIREAIAFLKYPPLETERRILLIDEFDLASRQAANALLKTLEEPPENVLIFLVTAHSGRLLTTILSRCKRILFAPLSPEQRSSIFNVPRNHAALINFISSDTEEAASLEEKAAALASISDSATKIITAFFHSEDKVERIRQLWNLGDFLLEGENHEAKFTGLLLTLRDGIMASVNAESSSLINPELAKHLGASVKPKERDMLVKLFGETNKTYESIRWHHANKKICVENLLTSLEQIL